LTALASCSDNFAVKEWLLAIGDRRQPGNESLAVGRLCDKEGCSAPIEGGGVFMLERTLNAVEEDWGDVAVLAAPLTIAAHCGGNSVVLDRDAIYAAGSIAPYVAQPGDGDKPVQWRIVRARDPASSRPWAPAYRPKKPAAMVAPVKPPTDADDGEVSDAQPRSADD
jgi:hypothetical protein